jgi:hypothetical protein
VRTEEHRAAPIAEAQDEGAHVAATERVEARHRLVEDDEFRLVEKRLREADALQHALGELAQLQPAFGAHADLVEQRRDAPRALLARDPQQRGKIGEQFLGGEVVVEIRMFRQVADPPPRVDVAGGPAKDLGSA